MKRQMIPETDSIRELAAFWDTHDVTEFNGQLEEVSEKVFQRGGQKVAIAFGLVEVPVELFPAPGPNARDKDSPGANGVLKVECFVPADKLPPAVLSRCSHVRPDKGGQKAYRLLVEAMRAGGYRALVKARSRGQERTLLLRLLENSLILERLTRSSATISHADEEPVSFKPGEIDLAKQLIGQMVVEKYDPHGSSTARPSRKAPIRTSPNADIVRLDDWIAKFKAPEQNRIAQVKTKGRRRSR